MTLQSSDQEDRLKYLEAVPVRMEVEAEGKQYVLVHAAQMELYERLNDEAVNIDCGCGYPELGGQLGCLRL